MVDIHAIRAEGVRIGADPLGGASVDYWGAIAERHNLQLTVVNPLVDATFRFMTLDTDGKIRMDCSSPNAMASLIANRESYQIATGNDADSDRHGIVTPDGGLLNPNHYLSVAIDYLYYQPAVVARLDGGRKDRGQLVDHRPGSRGTGPKASRSAGRLQVVRRRIARRHHRFRGRGERRGLVPAPRRFGVDHRQGWHHSGAAGLGDPRGNRLDALAAIQRVWPKSTVPQPMPASTRRPTVSRRRGWPSCRPSR